MMLYKHKHQRNILGFLLIAWSLIGCTAQPEPVRLAPTVRSAASTPTEQAIRSTDVPTAVIPATVCQVGYSWAYGSVPAGFEQQLQQALATAGIQGTVTASTFGENDGCGRYGAMSVDYHFTISAERLDDSQALALHAAQVLDIAKQHVSASSAPNLGNLQLIFTSQDQKCQWNYTSGAWAPSAAQNEPGWVTCALPAKP